MCSASLLLPAKMEWHGNICKKYVVEVVGVPEQCLVVMEEKLA
jgi:hypothetical protein